MKATQKRFSARRDLAVCIVVLVVLFGISGYLDLNEKWHVWANAHEEWELDEILTVLGFSTLGFAWFAFRRWRESSRELRERVEIMQDLRAEIATRQKTERSLRESDEMFTRAFHASPALCSISRLDDGAHFDVNDTWMATLGFSHKEAMANSAVELEIWAEAKDRAEFVERIKKERSVRGFETKFRTKDGRLLDFLVAGECLEVGDETRLLVVSNDITKRVEAERALRESEERLRQASQLAKIGYYIWDTLEDRCQYCSKEHARIHGLTPEEYIAQASALDGSFFLTHPDDREMVRDAFMRLRHGERVEIEYRAITPSGEARHVREIAEPVFDETGRVVQEIGTSQDVTDRKQVENQLRQSQKMDALGRLTGGVAHDFNNMLAAIIGNLELLGDYIGGDEQAKRSLDIAFKAAMSAAELTDRLLRFSRQGQVEQAVLNLGDAIVEMRPLLRTTLGETIELNTLLPDDTRNVWADPVQLQSMIVNLAANARDAMPNGGRFTIEAVNADFAGGFPARHPDIAPDSYVVLSIGDTGTGMSPEVKAKIFDPFFTTKEVGKGTGLGMSTVFSFMKQLGGHVEIDTAEGQGTCVKLYLPAADPGTEAATRAKSENAISHGSETILVVEDQADVSETALTLLENLGYRVVSAENGPSALALLEGGRKVDLIFTDTVMPGGMNGLDLAREALKRFPGIKVLRTSGFSEYAQDEDERTGQEIEWIAKPYFQKDLAEKIRQVLDGPRSVRPAAPQSPDVH